MKPRGRRERDTILPHKIDEVRRDMQWELSFKTRFEYKELPNGGHDFNRAYSEASTSIQAKKKLADNGARHATLM